MRPLEEAIEHAELVEDFHGRRVDRVAAEIAEEIGVLLENADPAPGAREKEAGHHARRPAADDDQVRIRCAAGAMTSLLMCAASR